jgi:hypothetical protein
VQINWDNGVPDVDLNQCWVNSIDYANANTAGLRTVYVDIDCPKQASSGSNPILGMDSAKPGQHAANGELNGSAPLLRWSDRQGGTK